MTLPPSITRYSEPVYDDIGMQPDAKGEWVKVSDLETASASLSPAAPAPGVTEALRNLVARLDEVHADKRYESVWAVSQLHVGPYSGPTYTDALNAARAALASTTAEPEGVVVHHHPDNHSSPALDRLVEAAARQFANPFDALRFEVVPAKDEHSPSYVLAVTTINPSGGMNSGTLIELNHNADFRIDDARARWAAAALNAKLSATHEDEESFYDIGKRDGYEEAVQEIDLATGGDGEFFGSTFPGETVDVPVMKQRIVDRFPPQSPTHRHKKRGTEYVLIGIGKMQAGEWFEQSVPVNITHSELVPVDMRAVAIYRSVTDPTEIWVRPREEFEDGRFEVIGK